MQLFIKQLTTIDSSFLCSQRGLVGETWLVDIKLSGILNDYNMVIDFSQTKHLIKKVIDSKIDHKLLVPIKSPLLNTKINTFENTVQLYFNRSKCRSVYISSPAQGIAFIPSAQITKEQLTKYIIQCVSPHLPDNIANIEVHLYHELIKAPYYRYSHGLRHHKGNCQRIAHGHRSKLEILINNEYRPDIVANWTDRWRDIYLGSKKDSINLAKLSIDNSLFSNHIGFRYQANQGEFILVIPKQECELIDDNTTVEFLAQYICQKIQAQPHITGNIRVIAYEGVGKGAICDSKINNV